MDKVKLPKEVAIAMDQIFKDMDDEQISWSVHNIIGCRVQELSTPGAKIKEYFNGKWMLFMQALVNGYEEQTPEEKLKKLYDSYDSWEVKAGIKIALRELGIKIQGVND